MQPLEWPCRLLYWLRLLVECGFIPSAVLNDSPQTLVHLRRPGSSVVERGPEKAGVGGSIPSLATTFPVEFEFTSREVVRAAQWCARGQGKAQPSAVRSRPWPPHSPWNLNSRRARSCAQRSGVPAARERPSRRRFDPVPGHQLNHSLPRTGVRDGPGPAPALSPGRTLPGCEGPVRERGQMPGEPPSFSIPCRESRPG